MREAAMDEARMDGPGMDGPGTDEPGTDEPGTDGLVVDGRAGVVEVERLPRRGELWRVRVEELAGTGEGVARVRVKLPTEERARTLRLALRRGVPGDEFVVEVRSVHRGQLSARPLRWEVRSSSRLTGACSHFGDSPLERTACGGCVWQSLPEALQRDAKTARVRGLVAGAGLDADRVEATRGVPARWSYRNKVELSFGASVEGGFGLGMRPAGFRREVLSQRECRIFSPAAEAWWPWLSARLEEAGLRAYEEGGDGVLRTLMVREGKRTGERMVELVTHQVPPETGGVVDESVERQVRAVLGDLEVRALDAGWPIHSLWWTRHVAGKGVRSRLESTCVGGRETIREELWLPGRARGWGFEIHPRSFFQPNTRGAERLYGEVASALERARRGGTLLDLYCGTGTIGICLSDRFERVVGIDLVEESVAMARRNAEANGVGNGAWYAGDAGEVLTSLQDGGARFDAVVVDPPRAGLQGAALGQVARTEASTLVYVSCNPESLVRDLSLLGEVGYALERVTPVDLFPHTPHVECVATLRRLN